MITIAISIGHMVIHPWICASPNLQRHILSMSCRVGHRTVQDANFEFLTRTCIGTLMTQAMDRSMGLATMGLDLQCKAGKAKGLNSVQGLRNCGSTLLIYIILYPHHLNKHVKQYFKRIP